MTSLITPGSEKIKVNFGKYKGKTLAQIAEEDPSYIRWLSENSFFLDIKQACQNMMAGKPAIQPKPITPTPITPPNPALFSKVALTYLNGVVRIKAPFELKDTIKSLSNRAWDSDEKVWKAPITILDEILRVFPGAHQSDTLREAIAQMGKMKEMSGAVKGNKDNLVINGNRLMPFQQAGVEFIDMAKGSALIADEMGLGKTIQALAYLYKHPELRPALIICPASLKLNWRREINIWLREDTLIMNGKGYEAGHKIYIINYDILKNHKDNIISMKPQIIIMDESHYIKNQKAKRTQLAIELSKIIPHRILLTGTPILNRPIELWPQLQIIAPERYNNFFAYAKKYCDATKTEYGWDFSGASNIPQLNDELKGIMVRRMKSQVLMELPEKRRSIIEFEIDNFSEYREAQKHFLDFIQNMKGDEARERALKAETLAKMESLKQLAIKGKMMAIKQWISDFLEQDEKLIIFATHRDTIAQIKDTFKDISVSLTGESSMEERQKAVDEFQNNPRIRLFIGNIKAAGVGITLTAASNVAFIELPWTPGEVVQAEDRAHRIGQRNAVNIYYLVASDTIDIQMAEVLKNKSQIIDSIMDGKETPSLDIFEELLGKMEK